jgi:hypothetical protein
MPDFKATLTQNGVAVSLNGHTHAGVMQSGTSFPAASPASGDLYYRTDLGVLCQYDGSRWLGPLEANPVIPWNAGEPWSTNTTTHLITVNQSIKLVSAAMSCLLSPNNASNYWTLTIDNNGVLITTLSTATYTAGSAFVISSNINSVLSTCLLLTLTIAKTGNPGAIRISPVFSFRRVY